MAQKELLLIDLSARLPYDPIVYVDENLPRLKLGAATRVWEYIAVDKPCKPYLRPMSSMTEEELYELQEILGPSIEIRGNLIDILDSSRHIFSLLELQAIFDWLNAHHFDYRGLIEKGLALEALEGMYK